MVKRTATERSPGLSNADAEVQARWDKCGPCGYVGCNNKGLHSVRTRKGWLNLCAECYDHYWHAIDFKAKLEEHGQR